MKLIRYTDLNNWESIFGDPFRAFAPFVRPPSSASRRSAAPRPRPSGVEWFEDDDNYYARVELPGVKREALRLDVEDGLIRLTHEIAGANEKEGARFNGAEQVLRCPEGIRASAIEARLVDGILHLVLPKEEVCKPVSITIH